MMNTWIFCDTNNDCYHVVSSPEGFRDNEVKKALFFREFRDDYDEQDFDDIETICAFVGNMNPWHVGDCSLEEWDDLEATDFSNVAEYEAERNS